MSELVVSQLFILFFTKHENVMGYEALESVAIRFDG
jgi:hypothetical protein